VDIRTLIAEFRGSEFKNGGGAAELLPELAPTKQPPPQVRHGFSYPIPVEKKRG